MSSVTAFEATTNFGELLKRVSQGEQIVITRHDRPIARLVPEMGKSSEEVCAAVAGLRALQKAIELRTGGEILSYAEMRSAIEEGRR